MGEVPGIRRVRFTTSHPRDFTRDIVEAIDRVPTLCDHVHLPVQSGSEGSSGRWRASTRRMVSGAHRMDQSGEAGRFRFPPTLLSGFPGETDDDFIQTMDLLAEVEYDCVFAFKYSARPNTPALVMIDSIPETEKAKRLQVLLERQREIQRFTIPNRSATLSR